MPRKFIYEQALVARGGVALDAADIGLIEAVYKKTLCEGDERVMLAVLENAVEHFQKYVLPRKPSGKQLFREAEEWFLDKDNEALFSFESICETLALNPDQIRKGLMGWKETRVKMSSIQARPASRPKLARSRIKHPSIRLSKTA